MRHLIIYIFAIFFLSLISSCSDDYFNVNVPAGTADEAELRMNDLLAPIIHSTMEAQRSAELVFGNYVQNFVSQEGGAAGETEAAGLWNQVYLFILPNLNVIQRKVDETGAIHYGAVADILKAINLGIATDTWDNIPYSEAAKGQENLSPSFDTQEQIYNDIFSLLDGAIAALQATDDSGISVGNEDLIYRGDLEKWLKAAYTIKARYQLHLLNTGVTSPSDVLTTIANGFTSNEDNFKMDYDNKNLNPWYASEVLARNTGNFHRDIASQMVSIMNGDYYPFQSGMLDIDPRLPTFATNGGDDEWVGYISGGGGFGPDSMIANAQFVTDGFYTSIDAPLILISYAEALFIKAEAAFLASGGTIETPSGSPEAYAAYSAGIAASMDMYNVDGSGYIMDASVDVGIDALMLHHIMKEKYIHNFLNPETFVDYRRYDFSTDVFTGLQIRQEVDSDVDYAGEWFRRATYPTSELTRNSTSVENNRQTPVTPVWWEM